MYLKIEVSPVYKYILHQHITYSVSMKLSNFMYLFYDMRKHFHLYSFYDKLLKTLLVFCNLLELMVITGNKKCNKDNVSMPWNARCRKLYWSTELKQLWCIGLYVPLLGQSKGRCKINMYMYMYSWQFHDFAENIEKSG